MRATNHELYLKPQVVVLRDGFSSQARPAASLERVRLTFSRPSYDGFSSLQVASTYVFVASLQGCMCISERLRSVGMRLWRWCLGFLYVRVL